MLKLKEENGKVSIIQEIEYKDRCLGIEVRISEKFGFVDLVVTDMATGDSLDLDVQLNSSPLQLEAEMTSNDTVFARLVKEGVEPIGLFKSVYEKENENG
jgi:hypothetical protein